MSYDTEKTASALAARAYAYRAFHVVFGAKPNAEVFSALGSEDTANALGILASLNGRSETGASPPSAFAHMRCMASGASDLERLAVEFDRLFKVPGEGYVYPWASAYEGGDNMMFRESTAEVRRAYAKHGFRAASVGHFPEDHVSMMLDFQGHLGLKAFNAFCEEDDAAARAVLEDQADFLDKHFGEWFPRFIEKVETCDRTGFYASAAKDLRAFVEADRVFLADALARNW